MCGVFGYIGYKDPLSVCLTGLEHLEYRGYDSTGIAGIQNGRLALCKKAGKLSTLKQHLNLPPLDLAIAHTRWATHGKVTDENAHPLFDASESIAIIHNGIIENYDLLKEELVKEGVAFSSETDTEIVAHLIAKYYKGNLVEALHHTMPLLKGIFAFLVIHKNHPHEIVAAARECSLSIATNDEQTEAWISSDPNSFFGEKLNILFLKRDEIARITKGHVELFDRKMQIIHKKQERLEACAKPPSKEGFEHFMLKEIFEQPLAIQRSLLGRIDPTIQFDFKTLSSEFFKKIDAIWIVGCGTSSNAGMLAAILFEELLRIPTRCEIASEARYSNPLLAQNTLVIALSQSGETADTLAAMRHAKTRGFKTLAICNVKNSSLVREADDFILLNAGPEISVGSTKAFTTQLSVLTLFALYLGQEKQRLSFHQQAVFLADLKKVPSDIEAVLSQASALQKLALRYTQYEDFFFMGRRYMFPSCLEAALKLKEISYVHANGYPAGELKHGPIALLNPHFPVIAFCANDRTADKIISNLMEVKARSAPILAFASEGMLGVEKIADDVFWLPPARDELSAFTSVVAGQLFAYYIAKERGCDIDQPRNLAKSVTVE